MSATLWPTQSPLDSLMHPKPKPAPLRGALSASMDSAGAHRASDVRAMFCNALVAVPIYFSNLRIPRDSLDVCVSFGLSRDSKFHSVVRNSDYDHALRWCREQPRAASSTVQDSLESVTEHWYMDGAALAHGYQIVLPPPRTVIQGGKTAIRVLTDRVTGRVLRAEAHSPCDVRMLFGSMLPFPAYDASSQVTYVQQLDVLVEKMACGAPVGCHTRRHCDTWSFQLHENQTWAVRLSEVTSADDNAVTYEMQLRMTLTPEQLPRGPEHVLRGVFREYADRVWPMFERLVTVHGRCREYGPGLVTDVLIGCAIGEDGLCRRIAAAFSRGMGRHEAVRQSLHCGVQPVALTRNDWRQLCAEPDSVWFAEKVDGVRLALYIDSGSGACTFDGNGQAMQLLTQWSEWSNALSRLSALTSNGNTLLDGILVRNAIANQPPLLLIFDLIQLNGTPKYSLPFAERQMQLHRLMAQYVQPALCEIPLVQRPFSVRAKKFLQLSELPTFRAGLARDGHGKRKDYDDSHAVAIDGLILVTTTAQYKWNPMHFRTVEFRAALDATTPDVFTLFCVGDQGNWLPAGTIHLDSAQIRTLCSIELDNEIIARHPQSGQRPQPPLFECCYNADTQKYELVRFRPDRHRPMYFQEFTHALLCLINPLTLREMLADLTKQ